MLDFKPLKLEHTKLLRPFFGGCRCRTCDCTVGGTFMWRDYYHTEFAVEDGVLYLKAEIDGRTAFTAPIGDRGPEAYGRILEYCAVTVSVASKIRLADTVARGAMIKMTTSISKEKTTCMA